MLAVVLAAEPIGEVCDAHDFADILCNDVSPSPRQLSDELGYLSKGVVVLHFSMQLPGDCTSVVADLEDNFGRCVRKRNRTKSENECLV